MPEGLAQTHCIQSASDEHCVVVFSFCAPETIYPRPAPFRYPDSWLYLSLYCFVRLVPIFIYSCVCSIQFVILRLVACLIYLSPPFHLCSSTYFLPSSGTCLPYGSLVVALNGIASVITHDSYIMVVSIFICFCSLFVARDSSRGARYHALADPKLGFAQQGSCSVCQTAGPWDYLP